jgi:hypothetical protein
MKEKRFKICSDGLMWRDVDGEAVILDMENDTYYSLNETGSLVWKMIDDKKSVEEIASMLSVKYGISAKKAEKDINEIISKFRKDKLITLA